MSMFIVIGSLAPTSASAQYYNYNYDNYGYRNNSNMLQIAQIQAQLDALRAQLNSLGYSSGSYNNYNVLGSYIGPSQQYTAPTCNFTYDLAIGSSGAQVADLNRMLGSSASSYFGQDTYNAVVRFQNQYASEILYPAGLTYANGYVGAFTRAKLNQLCNGITVGSVLGSSNYNYVPNNYNNNYGSNYNSNYNSNTCYNNGVYVACPYNTYYNPGTNYNYNYNSNTAYPRISLTANPSAVYLGGSTTLTWNTFSASTCTASGSWSGSKSSSGSESVTPSNSSRTYTLACYNNQGELSTGSVTVAIN